MLTFTLAFFVHDYYRPAYKQLLVRCQVSEVMSILLVSTALKYDLWTGLDVLVNNAGILISSDFASVSMEEVDRSMQV